MKEQYEFPPEFIWGASTAAHQIEGNNVASDWWAREHAERTDLSEPSGDAADSYHRYGEDIRMLADAGLGMYRFSIEWARIEPAEGCFSKAQLLHYRQMIDACHENGVEPMVTLNHMTLPLWLATKGGWLNADAVDYFARYVRYVMPILHDVTWVCTINEPNMVALTRGGTEGRLAARARSGHLRHARQSAQESQGNTIREPAYQVRVDHRLPGVPRHARMRTGDGGIPVPARGLLHRGRGRG